MTADSFSSAVDPDISHNVCQWHTSPTGNKVHFNIYFSIIYIFLELLAERSIVSVFKSFILTNSWKKSNHIRIWNTEDSSLYTTDDSHQVFCILFTEIRLFPRNREFISRNCLGPLASHSSYTSFNFFVCFSK